MKLITASLSILATFSYPAAIAATGSVVDDQTPSPTAGFAVDMPKVIRLAAEQALKDFPDIEAGDLLIMEDRTYFYCHPAMQWQPVDTRTLEIPSQKKAAALCNTRITLIIKDTLKRETTAVDETSIYCSESARYEAIHVTVFATGHVDSFRSAGQHSNSTPCDSMTKFHSIPEAIAQYTDSPVKISSNNPVAEIQ